MFTQCVIYITYMCTCMHMYIYTQTHNYGSYVRACISEFCLSCEYQTLFYHVILLFTLSQLLYYNYSLPSYTFVYYTRFYTLIFIPVSISKSKNPVHPLVTQKLLLPLYFPNTLSSDKSFFYFS